MPEPELDAGAVAARAHDAESPFDLRKRQLRSMWQTMKLQVCNQQESSFAEAPLDALAPLMEAFEETGLRKHISI